MSLHDFILELIKDKPPLNTAQICRLVHNVDINDIEFCRSTPEKDVKENRFKKYGKWGYYEHCQYCEINVKKVYATLVKMEIKSIVKGPVIRCKDPQKPLQKDLMRQWILSENHTNLIPYLMISGEKGDK